ncbi:hypothetical protein HYN69_08215 [Gemmobacter aquarius]|uniref:Uncharacterized protein n=1 Tax=Paragemmobacter aquarius TaxID=2169400 RepID=A0A2S0UL06_9RHOB|nr:hypothetical protein HYN69_08215 [Gemmobacter aquarius]
MRNMDLRGTESEASRGLVGKYVDTVAWPDERFEVRSKGFSLPCGRSGSSRGRMSLTAGPVRSAIFRSAISGVSALPGPAPTAKRDSSTLHG